MSDGSTAKVDKFAVAEVVFRIVRAPSADDKIPSAVRPGNMVDGGEHRKARLVDRAPCPRFFVIVPTDERPIEFLAGVKIVGAMIGDRGVDRQSIVFAGDCVSARLRSRLTWAAALRRSQRR